VQLIDTARQILREAEDDGTRLSQAALARKMRERGHTVANDRLHWLMTATQQTASQRTTA